MPDLSLQICRFTLAFIWMYQGIVPKWLGPHADELAINMATGATLEQAVQISRVGGTLEVMFGVLVFVAWRKPWVFALSALGIALLHAVVVVFQPALQLAAFNPVIINAAIMALSLIGHERARAAQQR
ncbi:MAG: DoxX-like family protein [Moraxellaceae bacterium]|nr:DoxX-like family protein [Moraxellaceae bacterium]